MNRWIVWASCAVPALILSACGGGAPSGPSGEITQSQASSFRSTGGDTLVTLTAPDADGVGGLFAGNTGRRAASLLEAGLRTAGVDRGASRTTCTLNKGSTTDADSDGIRDDSTDTYSCNFGSTGTFTLTGNTKVKDDLVDAAKGVFPLGGATVTPSLALEFSESSGGTTVTGSINTSGLWNFLLTGSTATGKVEITESVSVNASGQSASGKLGWYVEPWTVTPTDLANPKDKGSVSWKSYYQYDMGSAGSFTLEGTTTNLVYDSTCAGAGNAANYNGGYIEWVDGAGNKIRVTFATDCSETWTYNGTAI